MFRSAFVKVLLQFYKVVLKPEVFLLDTISFVYIWFKCFRNAMEALSEDLVPAVFKSIAKHMIFIILQMLFCSLFVLQILNKFLPVVFFQTIVLWSCRHVTENGLLVLVNSCRKLESINVWGTRVPVECFIALLTISPALQIKPKGLPLNVDASMLPVI